MRRLLLDQGLPRSTAALLTPSGWDVIHVSDIGMSRASGTEVLRRTRTDSHLCVTLDADFHSLLATGGERGPSVIRIRKEGLDAAALAGLLQATYQGLDRLNALRITFLTLRRRSPSLLAEIDHLPPSAWRTIIVDIPHRKYRTPRIYEQKVRPCEQSFRQFFIKDLGHEEPTILLTNDANSNARSIIARYARRMLIENALADAVRFLHIDALSSSVGPRTWLCTAR